MRLKDKVAIVTGGSQGIGEAIARAYGREGAKVVVVNSRRPELGVKVAGEIAAEAGTAIAKQADVTNRAQVQSLVKDVVDEFGTVDILTYSAGVMVNKTIEDYSEEDWDQMIDVNLKGVFLTAQAVVPVMKANGSGRIIIIASAGGTRAFPNALPYCASKGGVVMFTKALAAEIAKDGINVNAISPGGVATPMNQHLRDIPEVVEWLESRTATGRAYMTTEEMTGAAVFLASEEASAVHGLDMAVDDGLIV